VWKAKKEGCDWSRNPTHVIEGFVSRFGVEWRLRQRGESVSQRFFCFVIRTLSDESQTKVEAADG